MAKSAPPHPFADDQIVIALEAFAGYPDIVVKAGERLRGGDEVVRRWPEKFASDGLSVNEMRRLYSELRPPIEYAPHVPIAEQPQPLADEDAVVCIRNIRAAQDGDSHLGQPVVVGVGMLMPKSHPLVKARRDCFVPVVPPGRDRSNSVRALTGWTEYRKHEDGSFIEEEDVQKRITYGDYKQFQRWYAGQYVDKTLPEVRERPFAFEALY